MREGLTVNVILVLGSCGSALIFVLAILAIGRSIFRQITATEDNTKAVEKLTETIGHFDQRVSNLEIRIAVLEDRKGRDHGSS